jgi:site-specific DNA-methyltransferase (adenine-specific)
MAQNQRSPSSRILEGKKGADHGIDGWMKFEDGPEGHYERIIVQVKSGHVSVKDIRELRDVVSNQKAAIGVFITLEEPTSEMTKEARITEPYISSRWKKEYPKIQILTIQQILDGERPESPPTASPFAEAMRVTRVMNHTIKTLDENIDGDEDLTLA